MRRFVLSLAFALSAVLPAQADCVGQNLIAALPDADRAALEARAHAVPFAQGNLWQARRDGSEITLVGTYHLDDPRHPETLDILAPHLASASALLVEAGPEEEAALQADVAANPERLVITSGPTLPEALPPQDWQRLSEALRARAMPPFMAAKMQPWYVMVLLSIPACQFAQTASANGLDKQLVARAIQAGIPIRAVEPWDTLFSVFADLGTADQNDLLMQTVDADAAGDDMAVTLADSYFAGENRLLWEFTKLDAQRRSGLTEAEIARDFDMMEEVMITRRNKSWIPVIEEAASEGPVLVAVGALHLPGEEGVLNLLSQEGWTITPLAP
jgi:uncharacterized protein YbaP (TraB family)